MKRMTTVTSTTTTTTITTTPPHCLPALCLSVFSSVNFPLFVSKTCMMHSYVFIIIIIIIFFIKNLWYWPEFDKCLCWQNAWMHAISEMRGRDICNPNLSFLLFSTDTWWQQAGAARMLFEGKMKWTRHWTPKVGQSSVERDQNTTTTTTTTKCYCTKYYHQQQQQ